LTETLAVFIEPSRVDSEMEHRPELPYERVDA
jgi:hypothetical protein